MVTLGRKFHHNYFEISPMLRKYRISRFWTETRRHTHHSVALVALCRKNFAPSLSDAFGARNIPKTLSALPPHHLKITRVTLIWTRFGTDKKSKNPSSLQDWPGKNLKIPEIRLRTTISSFETSLYPPEVKEIIINLFCEMPQIVTCDPEKRYKPPNNTVNISLPLSTTFCGPERA